MRNSVENQVKELTEENEQLKRTVDELESKIEELHKQIDKMKGEENSVQEKIKRDEVSRENKPLKQEPSCLPRIQCRKKADKEGNGHCHWEA